MNNAEIAGGVALLKSTTGYIENSVFHLSYAFEGAALHILNAEDFLITGCTFTSNIASLDGAAISISLSQVNITDSLFTLNIATEGNVYTRTIIEIC